MQPARNPRQNQQRGRGRGGPGAPRQPRNAARGNPPPPPQAAPQVAAVPVAQPALFVQPAPIAAPVDGGPVLHLPRKMTPLEASKKYAPNVEPDSRTLEYLKAHNLPHRIATGPGSNPHATSAALRTIATVRALGIMLEEHGENARFVSMFSSPRDVGLADFLMKHTQINFYLDLYRPIITPKDNTRHRNYPRIDAVRPEHTSLLFVDIYNNFNPEFLIETISHFRPEDVMNRRATFLWVGRCFMADYGVCDGEAVWKREGDTVTFVPDPTTTERYSHEACDWIWDSSTYSVELSTPDGDAYFLNLSWTEVATVGTFKVVQFSFSIEDILPDPPLPFKHCYVEMSVPATRNSFSLRHNPLAWFKYHLAIGAPSYFLDQLPKQTLMLPRTIVFPIIDKYSTEKKKSYTLNRILSDILIGIENNKEWNMLVAGFPELRLDVHKTAWAILSYKLEERTELAELIAQTKGDLAARFNVSHGTQIGEVMLPPDTKYVPLVKAAAVLAGFGCVALMLRPSVRRVITTVAGGLIKDMLTGSLTRLFLGSVVPIATIQRNILARKAEITIPYNPFFVYSILIAPIIEEGFKRLFKGHKYDWALRQAIPIIEFVQQGCLPSYSYTWAMHEVASRLSFWPGCAVHAAWNFAVLTGMFVPQGLSNSAPGTVDFSNFVETYYNSPWAERRVVDTDIIAATTFAPELCALPTSVETNAEIPKPCTDLIVKGVPPFIVERNPTYFYSFIPTNIPGYVPSITDANLMAAVHYRILAAPPLDPQTQEKNWKWAYSQFSKCIPMRQFPTIVWEEEKDTWLEHFPSAKRTKYTKLLSEYSKTESHLTFTHAARKTDVFMKSNELLFRQKDGVYGLKPRVIINVSPRVQVLVGPPIYRAQQNLKLIWPTIPVFIEIVVMGKAVLLSVFYAGAATDADLTEWMEHVLVPSSLPKFSIAVCGDDSLVITDFFGEWQVWEGDASMFDQSESFGPLKTAYHIYRQLGVLEECIRLLYTLASNTYTVRSRKEHFILFINKLFRALRDTGGADTSLGNSIVMALCWIFVICLAKTFSSEEFKRLFLFLGIEIKLRFNTPLSCSFLKGMWYQTEEGLTWGPLPSRILKMGKSLTDPRVLYKTKDLQKAATFFLNDVASSYRCFLQVPFVKEFVCNFHKEDRADSHKIRDMCYVKSSSLFKRKLLPEAIDQVCQRYGFTEEELKATLAIFPKVPFVFYCSPVFLKLVTADYW